jgi:hypothetical protein
VVAEVVEWVDVQAVAVGSRQTFVQFQVKDGVAEALASSEMIGLMGKTDAEQRCFG